MEYIDQGKKSLVVEDVVISGHMRLIQIRCYRPLDLRMKITIVLFFHGGGFVSRAPEESKRIASAIASETPAWVIAVEYSLAPEFPFPTALEDGYRALQWAATNARSQGADPARIAVLGHEAGANLATCLAAMIRDRGEWDLSGQALLAPLLDPSLTRIAAVSDERYLDSAIHMCATNYRAYLPKPMQRLHPYAAPIESRRLSGLPSTFIAVAAQDVFCAESQAYANVLKAAGISVKIKYYPDSTHHAIATSDSVTKDVVGFLMRCMQSPI